jgi:hypothetical protein
VRDKNLKHDPHGQSSSIERDAQQANRWHYHCTNARAMKAHEKRNRLNDAKCQGNGNLHAESDQQTQPRSSQSHTAIHGSHMTIQF